MLIGNRRRAQMNEVKAKTDPNMIRYAHATQACGVGWGRGSRKVSIRIRYPKLETRC